MLAAIRCSRDGMIMTENFVPEKSVSNVDLHLGQIKCECLASEHEKCASRHYIINFMANS